jgi:hypothetical protein
LISFGILLFFVFFGLEGGKKEFYFFFFAFVGGIGLWMGFGGEGIFLVDCFYLVYLVIYYKYREE